MSKTNDELDDFHDEIAMQLDKRKIQRLINDGVVSFRDIAEAEIIDNTESSDD